VRWLYAADAAGETSIGRGLRAIGRKATARWQSMAAGEKIVTATHVAAALCRRLPAIACLPATSLAAVPPPSSSASPLFLASSPARCLSSAFTTHATFYHLCCRVRGRHNQIYDGTRAATYSVYVYRGGRRRLGKTSGWRRKMKSATLAALRLAMASRALLRTRAWCSSWRHNNIAI